MFCLSLLLATLPVAPIVDAGMPAGCIKFISASGDVVRVKHDYRDTKTGWFYWAFRVRGAAGRRLHIEFPRDGMAAIGSRGAAVSTDCGKTWTWSDDVEKDVAKDELGDHKDWWSFDWTFADGQDEVWFSQTIPYGAREWEAFLARHEADRGRIFETGTLCTSKKGRPVEYARFGRLDGRARERIFVSSRHHCQEATATYVVEGMLETVFAKDELGAWLRDNVEVRVVPFVDKDGVVDGDQGKNRTPWDHCRDYNNDRPQAHPEVAAIMRMLREWKPTGVQDTHCPWLRGDWTKKDSTNEYIYQPGNADNTEAIGLFGRDVERLGTSRLGYRPADNVPYGTAWNTGANFKQGLTLNAWAQANVPSARFVTSWEIPFANARKKTLYPKEFRAFGRDLMAAWRSYLMTTAPGRPDMRGDWCSIGTSISWYNDNVGVAGGRFTRGYQDRVREVLDFAKLLNVGISGGTTASHAAWRNFPKARYYTIEHGVNDWGKKVPVGTLDQYCANAATNTFCANYRKIIETVRRANPEAKIILCTPRKAYGFGTYLPPSAGEAKDGVYLKEYAEAVRAIAVHEKLPVADFFATCGENDELKSLSIDTALHPNDAGYQRMADELLRVFKTFVP